MCSCTQGGGRRGGRGTGAPAGSVLTTAVTPPRQGRPRRQAPHPSWRQTGARRPPEAQARCMGGSPAGAWELRSAGQRADAQEARRGQMNRGAGAKANTRCSPPPPPAAAPRQFCGCPPARTHQDDVEALRHQVLNLPQQPAKPGASPSGGKRGLRDVPAFWDGALPWRPLCRRMSPAPPSTPLHPTVAARAPSLPGAGTSCTCARAKGAGGWGGGAFQQPDVSC